MAAYFSAIRARRGKRLPRYPGSPALIAQELRRQDRALFVELMPAEARAADREIETLGRFRTQIDDGYAALKAFLPPEERRGLVLIDPPYESLDELKAMLQAFADAYRRWPTGIYLMWYPIRSATQRSMVHARFEALRIPKMLFADLAIHPDDAGLGLAGSGLMIVNPPYGADTYLRDAYEAPFTRGLPPRAWATWKLCDSRPSEWHNRARSPQGPPDGSTDFARTARQALHADLTEAQKENPAARKSLDEILPEVKRLVDQTADAPAQDRSLPERLEGVAVRFEAEHPTLAASVRQLVEHLLSEVGI